MDWDSNLKTRKRRRHWHDGFGLPPGMTQDQSVRYVRAGYGWWSGPLGTTAQQNAPAPQEDEPGEGMAGGPPLQPGQFEGEGS
jgi:hypothetical protein